MRLRRFSNLVEAAIWARLRVMRQARVFLPFLVLLPFVPFALLSQAPRSQDRVSVPGLQREVEILRDRWGVPHIYAENTHDLFFAQGFITARDRLFQLDIWRRIGTGKLAEVLGPQYVPRDRIARLVRFRGDWNAEWAGYGPDAKLIATAFTDGINAQIRSLHGQRTPEFQKAGFDPGLWAPEDVTARVAGLLMTGNMLAEVNRALDVQAVGLGTDARLYPPDPQIPLLVPQGLQLTSITPAIVSDYVSAIGAVHFPGEQGSNNWVVDGTMTRTGKPLLANDPHRPIEVPSLRKTVHLVAPGWNVIGAGEPALPGIALGHNENVAWGFTIVGIDQQDLYVEKLDPQAPGRYLTPEGSRAFEVEQVAIDVKGRNPQQVELKYTRHGPVIYEDQTRHLAYALRWVGTQPGGAGYLPALKLSHARNWSEFREAASSYLIPSENLVYADTGGNIGWIAAGQAPIRSGWSGLFPVPGDSDSFEWSGLLPVSENPSAYNPPRHFVATANHNILPPGYRHAISYAWAYPSRYRRIVEMLGSGRKFGVADFARMQQDTVSLPARDFQNVLRKWHPPAGSSAAQAQADLLHWNCNMSLDSRAALIFEVWIRNITDAVSPPGLHSGRLAPDIVLSELERQPKWADVLARTLDATRAEITQQLGPDSSTWTWGHMHQIHFPHMLPGNGWDLPARDRPGDAFTVNATGGPGFSQSLGASYRQVLDPSDWDRSIMTNVPGESGVPGDRHYGDLIEGWADGNYHPMPYSRKAVEAATDERLLLVPSP
jgi:penicillin G amidase